MVAATFALLGRTVDIVTSSPWECRDNAAKFQKFYTTLHLSASSNLDKLSKQNVRLKQSILYCCDANKWQCSDNDVYAEEEDKSLNAVRETTPGGRQLTIPGSTCAALS